MLFYRKVAEPLLLEREKLYSFAAIEQLEKLKLESLIQRCGACEPRDVTFCVLRY